MQKSIPTDKNRTLGKTETCKVAFWVNGKKLDDLKIGVKTTGQAQGEVKANKILGQIKFSWAKISMLNMLQ